MNLLSGLQTRAKRHVLFDSPIILGNAPSTGSTLVRVLLGRHPSIAAGGELSVLDKPGLFRESSASYRRNIARWLRRGYPGLFLGSGNDLFRHLDEYPWDRASIHEMCSEATSYPEMLSRFFARNVEHFGASRWMEKTPANIYCFMEIRSLFPSAKFVHIVRDGRDAAVSYFRRSNDPFYAVSRWYYATLTGIQYRRWPNYYELRYEDLVEDPASELRRLCDFLDEPYSPDLLKPSTALEEKLATWKSSPFEGVNKESRGQHRGQMPESIKSMFHHVCLSRHGIQSLPFEGNTTGLLPPIELQQHLGYDTDGLAPCSPVDRSDRRSAVRGFRHWRFRQLRRYRKWPGCPTRLL